MEVRRLEAEIEKMKYLVRIIMISLMFLVSCELKLIFKYSTMFVKSEVLVYRFISNRKRFNLVKR